MKLTKDIMKATGETIAVCEQLDVDPRLVARVLLGVVDWSDREPELAVEAPPPAPSDEEEGTQEAPRRSRFRDVPPNPARPFERYTAPLPVEGERDAKGRKVVKRDHNWRENTLQRMQVGESALMSYLLEQMPGVTRGAMAQRMAMLVAEGHLEQLGPGSWRRIK